MMRVWSGGVGVAVALVAWGCAGVGGDDGAMNDSTYVRTMGTLRRIHDVRQQNPVPQVPQPPSTNGRPPSREDQARRDSLQMLRTDSVRAVDSLARDKVLRQERVTTEQLMAKARALATDPQRLQKISEAIGRTAFRLDSLARQAAVDSATRARADSLARRSADSATKRSGARAP